jgi:hypothetical protein
MVTEWRSQVCGVSSPDDSQTIDSIDAADAQTRSPSEPGISCPSSLGKCIQMIGDILPMLLELDYQISWPDGMHSPRTRSHPTSL